MLYFVTSDLHVFHLPKAFLAKKLVDNLLRFKMYVLNMLEIGAKKLQ